MDVTRPKIRGTLRHRATLYLFALTSCLVEKEYTVSRLEMDGSRVSSRFDFRNL